MSKRRLRFLSDTDQNKRVAKKPRTDQTNFGEKPEAEPDTVEYLDQASPDIETDSVDNDYMDDAATEKDTNAPDAYDTEDEDVVEIPKPTTNSTTTTQVPDSWTKRKKWTKTDLARLNALLQKADCSLLDIIAAFPDFSKDQITSKISYLAKKEEAAKEAGLACKFKERQSELKKTPSKSPIVDDKSGESGKSSLRVSDEKNGNPNTLVSPASTKKLSGVGVVKGMSTRKNLNVEHTEKQVAKQGEASKANTPWPPEAQRINIAEKFGSMDEIQEQRMKCEKKIEECTKKLEKWQRKKRFVDNVSKQLKEVSTKKQRSAAPEDG